MARPTKQGVDYFPLDVHMDDKFKFIEIKFKLEGFAVVVKLMQRVYSNGYWCKWTEDEQLLFCDENKLDPSLLHEIFLECLKREIFHDGMYLNYNILTSKGIQKRYKEMIRRRKDVEWITDYLLIDDINTGSSGVIDDINPKKRVIDDINPSLSRHDDVKSTQSKVNKTKINETKINNNNAFDFYQQNFGTLSPFVVDDINQWINDLNEPLVIESMKITKQQNKQWRYAVGILKDWHSNNIRTLEDVAAHTNKFTKKGGGNNATTTGDAERWKQEYNIPF